MFLSRRDWQHCTHPGIYNRTQSADCPTQMEVRLKQNNGMQFSRVDVKKSIPRGPSLLASWIFVSLWSCFPSLNFCKTRITLLSQNQFWHMYFHFLSKEKHQPSRTESFDQQVNVQPITDLEMAFQVVECETLYTHNSHHRFRCCFCTIFHKQVLI